MNGESKIDCIELLEQYRHDVSGLGAAELSNKYKLTYASWRGMKQRAKNMCILLDQRFESFNSFLHILGPRLHRSYTLDRIDPKGPYSPENCRWADKQTQALNRTNAVKIEFRGESLPLQVWADRLGVSRDVLYKRRSQGWTDEEIIRGQRYSARSLRRQNWPWPEVNEMEWERAYNESGGNETREEFLWRMSKEILEGVKRTYEQCKHSETPLSQEFQLQWGNAHQLHEYAREKMKEKRARDNSLMLDLIPSPSE